jgi:hypothetical protein
MKNRFLLALAASLALAACGSDGAPDEVVYGVAVYTQPSPGADFAPYSTYYVDPEITVHNNGVIEPDTTPMTADIKAAIVAGMNAAGYVEVTDQATADLGLKLGYATGSVDYYYSGGYCDIYYGWYGCYYPPVYAGSYRFGAAILGMVDLTVPQPPAGSPPTAFPGVWFSSMYSVLADYQAGSTTYNKNQLILGIERSFDQSPYLAQ